MAVPLTEFDTQVAALAASLVRHGYDSSVSEAFAVLSVTRLMRWCWSYLTDVIGDGEQVDAIADLVKMPPGALPRILVKHGLLRVYKGHFYMPMAYRERSASLGRRWKKENKDVYFAARERASRSYALPLVDLERSKPHAPAREVIEAGKTDIFGEKIVVDTDALKPKKKRKSNARRSSPTATPGHKELTEYWVAQWSLCHSGAKYPYRVLDATIIKKILQATSSVQHAKQVLDAYLAEPGRYYLGKGLKKCWGDIARFIAAAGGPSSRGVTYARASEPLPDLSIRPGPERSGVEHPAREPDPGGSGPSPF